MFQSIVCPHYTSECIIYLGLAIAAAPQGQLVNATLLSALSFVLANLSVTADATRTSYAQRFGAESIEHRWRMIPGIY